MVQPLRRRIRRRLHQIPHRQGILDGARARGDLEPGTTIIGPTSGNTGSEIARLTTARGYDVEYTASCSIDGTADEPEIKVTD